MHTDRDTTRLVRSWLEEGATALPDRVLDAVLDQVPATPQRRSWWPARRSADMNNRLEARDRGRGRRGRRGGRYQPPATERECRRPAPSTSTPTPTPRHRRAQVVDLARGPLDRRDLPRSTTRAVTRRRPSRSPCRRLDRRSDGYIGKNVRAIRTIFDSREADHRDVYTDVCQSRGTLVAPVGPTVDDLVDALFDQAEAGRFPAGVALRRRLRRPSGSTWRSRPTSISHVLHPVALIPDLGDSGDGGFCASRLSRTASSHVLHRRCQRRAAVIDTMYLPGMSERPRRAPTVRCCRSCTSWERGWWRHQWRRDRTSSGSSM